MLSGNTPAELAALYQNALEKNDSDAARHIERESFKRLNDFLDGSLAVDVDESPYWLTFARALSQSADVDLKMAAKKAEVKLVPLLKEFDADVGFDFSDRVDEATLERNLTDLDAFEKIDPFEREDFRQILKLIQKISLSTDDGTVYKTADFQQDVLKSAQMKSFLRLCLNLDKITSETYFATLLEEMERLLVTLFVMDKAGDSLDENEMRAEYEKLLNAID